MFALWVRLASRSCAPSCCGPLKSATDSACGEAKWAIDECHEIIRAAVKPSASLKRATDLGCGEAKWAIEECHGFGLR